MPLGRCAPRRIPGGIISAVLLAPNVPLVCQHALQLLPMKHMMQLATLRAMTQNPPRSARMPMRFGTCVLAALPGGIPSAVQPVLFAQVVVLLANRRSHAVLM